jgi:hypothetical protein
VQRKETPLRGSAAGQPRDVSQVYASESEVGPLVLRDVAGISVDHPRMHRFKVLANLLQLQISSGPNHIVAGSCQTKVRPPSQSIRDCINGKLG